jgi:hypothetical protein
MIKLNLPEKPDLLTDELVRDLTAKFKAEGSDVWNAKFIREAVLAFSYGKCCYTECKLDEESKYMEIDHFYAKSAFPDKVVEWGNLLPSSKKSNTTKGEHNILTNPIVNPCIDNPKTHLYISNYRYYPITRIGKETIEVVALNDRQHFVNKRSRIGHQVSEMLNNIHDEIEDEAATIIGSPRRQRKLAKNLKSLMQESTRTNEYSATISTVILTDEYYPAIERFFIDNGFWDEELTELKVELEFCSLRK